MSTTIHDIVVMTVRRQFENENIVVLHFICLQIQKTGQFLIIVGMKLLPENQFLLEASWLTCSETMEQFSNLVELLSLL